MESEDYPRSLLAALVAETERRLFEESVPRVKKCLSLLSEEEVWRRPNDSLSSVGNLVLHLCGNARQWLVSGLGGAPDERDRSAEFERVEPLPIAELLRLLDELESDCRATLAGLRPEDLRRVRSVQVFEESGLSILVHVVEHFSYHVGQISWETKRLRGIDLGYYAGQSLG